jgi:ribosomal protein L4
MKAQLYDIKGNKKAEVELPGIFNTHVREDITQKCFEVSKEMQQYGIYVEAGKRHSASGLWSPHLKV